MSIVENHRQRTGNDNRNYKNDSNNEKGGNKGRKLILDNYIVKDEDFDDHSYWFKNKMDVSTSLEGEYNDGWTTAPTLSCIALGGKTATVTGLTTSSSISSQAVDTQSRRQNGNAAKKVSFSPNSSFSSSCQFNFDFRIIQKQEHASAAPSATNRMLSSELGSDSKIRAENSRIHNVFVDDTAAATSHACVQNESDVGRMPASNREESFKKEVHPRPKSMPSMINWNDEDDRDIHHFSFNCDDGNHYYNSELHQHIIDDSSDSFLFDKEMDENNNRDDEEVGRLENEENLLVQQSGRKGDKEGKEVNCQIVASKKQQNSVGEQTAMPQTVPSFENKGVENPIRNNNVNEPGSRREYDCGSHVPNMIVIVNSQNSESQKNSCNRKHKKKIKKQKNNNSNKSNRRHRSGEKNENEAMSNVDKFIDAYHKFFDGDERSG